MSYSNRGLRYYFIGMAFTFPFVFFGSVWAQDTFRSVTDWTDAEPTAEALAEALQPRESPPPLTRSLRRASCERFHQQISRGIRPAPVSQRVALSVEFDSDSASLTPRARRALDELGRALEDPILARCCFQIEGHTDSQNSEDYNLQLSEARAERVASYLIDQFAIESDRLLREALGESQPLVPNDSPEGRQKNRRVQVMNLGYQTAEASP